MQAAISLTCEKSPGSLSRREIPNMASSPGLGKSLSGSSSRGCQPASSRKDWNACLSKLIILIVAAGWMGVSSGLILLNKYLLKDLGFHYPMALSGLGMLSSSICSFITCHVLRLVEPKRQVSYTMWLAHMMPVGLFMALSLQLGNYAYLELTVAFIQMLKALCPVFTLVALALAKMLVPSLPLVASVLLISIGVVISSYGEVNFSWIGMGAMLGSEAAEAARLVITQLLLVGMKFHPIEGLLYLAPACSLWLASGSAIWEFGAMQREGAWSIVQEHWPLFLCAAMMGFLVNILSLWVIRLASGLSLKVLATLKNTLLVTAGALFLDEVVTPVQTFGYMVTMLGFIWYQAVFVPPTPSSPNTKQEYEPVQTSDSPTSSKTPLLQSPMSYGGKSESDSV